MRGGGEGRGNSHILRTQCVQFFIEGLAGGPPVCLDARDKAECRARMCGHGFVLGKRVNGVQGTSSYASNVDERGYVELA